jgi:hypothetical protein
MIDETHPPRVRKEETVKRLLVLAAAVLAAAAVAAPAHADEPTIIRDLQLHQVISDPTACGDFGVIWDINITADIFTFFNSEGVRERQLIHIRENNTITNTATGLTLQEGPDSFLQTTYFLPSGTGIDYIVATGLQARVGNELRDVGRVVLEPLGGGRFDLVFAAGPHPVREAADDGTLVDALAGFCDVLS